MDPAQDGPRVSLPVEHAPPTSIQAWVAEQRGARGATFEPLPGGGGNRRYWRVRVDGGGEAMLMHARPERSDILPPALRVPTAELPFVAVTDLLRTHDIPVPEIFAVHAELPFVLLEDLGDQRLFDLPEPERGPWRREAIDCLVRVHAIEDEPALPFERCFDAEWVGFELDLFAGELAPGTRARLAPVFEAIARSIAVLPRVLSLRDFQSQNLMIDSAGRLRVIDHQDALLAPPELDLAAFLLDSYAPPAPDERESLLERYARSAGRHVSPESFALLALQRKSKDLSRYRLLVRAGDSRFRPFAAVAERSVRDALPLAARALAGHGPELESAFDEALRELAE